MKTLGVIAGIMMSILGGYAFFMPMDMFLRLSWGLGVLFICSGIRVFIPVIKEKIKAKKQKEEKQPEQIAGKKARKQVNTEDGKKAKNKNVPQYILGALELLVGIVLFISGITKTMTDMALVYLVGSCVMFFGVIQLSLSTAKPKEEEEPQKPVKKKKKKSKEPEPEPQKDHRTLKLICSVISLAVGALAVCCSFIDWFTVDTLIAINIVIQGINMVVSSLYIVQKK